MKNEGSNQTPQSPVQRSPSSSLARISLSPSPEPRPVEQDTGNAQEDMDVDMEDAYQEDDDVIAID